MSKKPYINWSREEFHNHLERQALDYNYSLEEIKLAIWDEAWKPSEQYNGCNFVQDDLHPFLPCFIHDYEWVVQEGGNSADMKFKRNLILFGFPKWKANIYYIAVRVSWYVYFKWTK